MKMRIGWGIVALGLVPGAARAQVVAADSSGPRPASLAKRVGQDIYAGLRDGVVTVQQGVRVDQYRPQTWLGIAGGAVVLTGTVLWLDGPVRRETQRWRTTGEGADIGARKVASAARFYGNGAYIIGTSSVLYVGGWVVGKPAWQRIGREIVTTAAVAGLTTTALKVLIGRARPYTDRGPRTFVGIAPPSGAYEHGNDHYSLPSGHTTAAFALSSTLAAETDQTWLKVGLYGMASLTGLSRVYHDKHWLGDTLLGAAIGTVTGRTVVHIDRHYRHEADKPDATRTSWNITPLPTGLGLTVRF